MDLPRFRIQQNERDEQLLNTAEAIEFAIDALNQMRVQLMDGNYKGFHSNVHGATFLFNLMHIQVMDWLEEDAEIIRGLN